MYMWSLWWFWCICEVYMWSLCGGLMYMWSVYVKLMVVWCICEVYMWSLWWFDVYVNLELPMFCQNVDSFLFRQISGALSACSHALLGKVMPNISSDVDWKHNISTRGGVNGRFLTLLQVLVFFKVEAMQSWRNYQNDEVMKVHRW